MVLDYQKKKTNQKTSPKILSHRSTRWNFEGIELPTSFIESLLCNVFTCFAMSEEFFFSFFAVVEQSVKRKKVLSYRTHISQHHHHRPCLEPPPSDWFICNPRNFMESQITGCQVVFSLDCWASEPKVYFWKWSTVEGFFTRTKSRLYLRLSADESKYKTSFALVRLSFICAMY